MPVEQAAHEAVDVPYAAIRHRHAVQRFAMDDARGIAGQEQNAVGERDGLAQIVRDEQHRVALITPQIDQQLAQAVRRRFVQ